MSKVAPSPTRKSTGTTNLTINLSITPLASLYAFLTKIGGINTVSTMPTMPTIHSTPNKNIVRAKSPTKSNTEKILNKIDFPLIFLPSN